MTNKERYQRLCETEGTSIPLFLQFWWMDAVSHGKRWDVALAYAKDGSIAGALPYLIGEKLGMRYILQPQLTPYNGPWYNYNALSADRPVTEFRRLNFERSVAQQLISDIEGLRLSCYSQCFSPSVTNWQPFYEQGYSQSTRYTYCIPDLSDIDRVFAGFIDDRKKKIRQWETSVSLEICDDAQWFADFHTRYWQEKGQQDLMSQDFIVRLCTAAINRNSGVIFRLRDDSDTCVAAAFMPYDANAAYLLQTAHLLNYRHNELVVLLIWKALQWFSTRTKSFDFEGSMTSGGSYFNQSFGAIQVPFFQVTKYSNPLIRWWVERK